MAKAPERSPPEAGNSERPSVDGKEGLQRLADLTRRVIAVPKDEVPPIFTKPKKKRPKRKRDH